GRGSPMGATHRGPAEGGFNHEAAAVGFAATGQPRLPKAGQPQEPRGNTMRASAPLGVLGLLVFAAAAAPCADAATITGAVKGRDGAPFRGAFVQARHAGLKMTVSVLTDNQGRYVAENLPEGDYRIGVRAIGFKTDLKTGVKLTADQNASFDFALAATPVRWSDISIYQGLKLLP